MARPREFDESAVINRALQQFWANGYEATSVDDLCAVTGLNRSSLYRAFGSKRDLLDVALAAYEANALNGIARLFAQHPIDDAARLFLSGLFGERSDAIGRWGCLIGNCAGSWPPATRRRGSRSAAASVASKTCCMTPWSAHSGTVRSRTGPIRARLRNSC